MNPFRNHLPIHPIESAIQPLERASASTSRHGNPTRGTSKNENPRFRIARRVGCLPQAYSCDSDPVTHDSSTTMKSRSIPIQKNGLTRTASELQLSQDEEMADFRDYLFFSRLVDGISRQQKTAESNWCRKENDMCIEHIFYTRHSQDGPSAPTRSQPSLTSANSTGYSPAAGHSTIAEDDEIFSMEL